jgi:hypothetical protein
LEWYDNYPAVGVNGVDEVAPEFIWAVPRIRWDLEALWWLFSADTPAIRSIRPCARIDVRYGFVDASGSGFGGSVTLDGKIAYQIGVWGRDMEDLSSNYRELRNLVETLEVECKAGNLKDCEIFMMTDNSTAELSWNVKQ